MDKINVMLDEGAYMPERAHDADAGYDIRTPIDVTLYGDCTIDTGVHIQIPSGYVGFLKSKSGLNVKHNITGEGVIDSGYTGSIVVKLYSNRPEWHEYRFKRGDKVIQLILLPIYTPELEEVDMLDESERGNNGFGSTGR